LRILVTGGAGYIGCQVVLRLCEAGHEVSTLDNLSSGHREMLPGGEFMLGDIRNTDDVASAMARSEAEAVFHMAAVSDLRESIGDPQKYYANNVVGTLNVARAGIEAGVKRIVFSSSAAVYGIPDTDTVAETAPLQPISPYGRTKLISEQILADFAAASDMTYTALRFFNVAGADPGGHCGESGDDAWHLIKVACQAAVGLRDGLTINGTDYPTADGTCVRDYVHVDDVALAHIASLEYLVGGGASENLNVGYGRGASVREIVALISAQSDRDFPIHLGPARDGDPAHLVAAAQKIRNVLGWSPQYDDLKFITRSALDWEKKIAPPRT